MGDEDHRPAEASPRDRRRSLLSLKRVISSSAAKGSSMSRSFGLVIERAGDRHAHLHAAGEFARIGVGEVLEADHAERLHHVIVRRGLRRCPSGEAAARHCRTPSPTASASAPGRRSRSRDAHRRRRAPSSASRSSPEVGSPRPAMMRSAVDLPQPDGPSRLTNSPSHDVERHVLQRDRAVREGLRDAAERDERGARLARGAIAGRLLRIAATPSPPGTPSILQRNGPGKAPGPAIGLEGNGLLRLQVPCRPSCRRTRSV